MTLRDVRQSKGLTQSRLSAMTGIPQPTLSNLEQGHISPTTNQRFILEQALGPIEWPVNREFSLPEKDELVRLFAVLVNLTGPRQALTLLATARNNDELRGLAALFAHRTEPVEVITLPQLSQD